MHDIKKRAQARAVAMLEETLLCVLELSLEFMLSMPLLLHNRLLGVTVCSYDQEPDCIQQSSHL